MLGKQKIGPESSAVRVALWRALHGEIDAPPHVIEDDVGLALVAPQNAWRKRPDMNRHRTASFRASIVARARFIEDLIEERAGQGVKQYVILGAGLDSFAQRRTALASRLKVFEIDQPGPQTWKRNRLIELGYGVPNWLHFVPVDFEAGEDWWQQLAEMGFDPMMPAVIASTGVSMYLSKKATTETMRRAATMASGSSFVMSFLLPLDRVDPQIRPGMEQAAKGAAANGTPFISFFTPEDVISLAGECGLKNARHVSADALAALYFSGRTDGLRPPRNAEELMVAET